MSGHKYTVEFRIVSNTLDPSNVTQELGLQPCQTRIEGTLRQDGKLQRGMWAYNGGTEYVEWDSLDEGLSFVLEKLWPHRKQIAVYRTSGELIRWCGHFQSTFDGGPTLGPALLKRLGEFGAELFIDNYFSDLDKS